MPTNVTIEKEFGSTLNGRKICCWGCGEHFKTIVKPFLEISGFSKYVIYLLDTNKAGQHVSIGERDIIVAHPNVLKTISSRDFVILICVEDYVSIAKIIEEDNYISKFDYYNGSLLGIMYSDNLLLENQKPPLHYRKNVIERIPKVINAIWLSDKPLSAMPDLYKYCVESWEKYCPDYKIKIWGIDDYHSSCEYFNEAIGAQKWAFASDYARTDILYQYGGIYMDLDEEVISSIDDLIYNEAFIGFESSFYISCGCIGAVKKNKILEKIRESYLKDHFIKEDRTYNLTTSPKRYTEILLEHGLQLNGDFQFVDDITIYPFEVLTAKSCHSGKIYKTKHTYAMQHYNGSWMSEKKEILRQKQYETIDKILQGGFLF